MNSSFNGLINLGNTCYFNSCIQLLFQCKKLIEFFLDNNNKFSDEQILSFQFHRLMKGMHTLNKKIAPETFWNTFKKIFKHFDNQEQHDSQEALLLILDRLHEELKDNKNNSIIKELFEGKLETSIKCLECKTISNTIQPFFHLVLNFPDFDNPEDYDIDNQHVTFNELIKYNFQDELFENDNLYSCEHCNKKTKAIKKNNITHLPEYLLLYMKRFDINQNKLVKVNDLVDIDEYIHMNKYFDINNKYKWNNSIVQFGSLNGGHYINVSNINEHKYIILDDSNVHILDKNQKNKEKFYFQSYVYCFTLTN